MNTTAEKEAEGDSSDQSADISLPGLSRVICVVELQSGKCNDDRPGREAQVASNSDESLGPGACIETSERRSGAGGGVEASMVRIPQLIGCRGLRLCRECVVFHVHEGSKEGRAEIKSEERSRASQDCQDGCTKGNDRSRVQCQCEQVIAADSRATKDPETTSANCLDGYHHVLPHKLATIVVVSISLKTKAKVRSVSIGEIKMEIKNHRT